MPPESTFLCPPPLEEAVTFELYERCINPNPAISVTQEQDQTSDGQEQTTKEGVRAFITIGKCVHRLYWLVLLQISARTVSVKGKKY